MKTKVIIINGKPRVGKDTFMDISSEILKNESNLITKYSLIDPIRNFAPHDSKDQEYRKALYLMKKALEEVPSYSLITLAADYIKAKSEQVERASKYKAQYIFLCMREESDILKLKELLKDTGIPVVKVLVKGTPELESLEYGNPADDSPIDVCNYNYVIENNSTLKIFIRKTVNFWNLEE